MKVIRKISFLVITIMMVLTLNVFAAEMQVELTGNAEGKPGDTQTIEVKVSSETEAVGVLSGKLKFSDNITNVKISGQNEWSVQYNTKTGDFNALKAEGAKNEVVAQITYTIKSEAQGKVSLTLGDGLKASTTAYKSVELGDVTKEITIKISTPVPTERPNPTPTAKPNPTPTPTATAKPTTKPTPTVKPTTNPVKTATPVPTAAAKPTVIPKAGTSNCIVIAIISAILISAVVYLKYKKYNKI